MKATPDPEGRPQLAANPEALAKEVFEKLGIAASILKAAETDGRSIYVMDTGSRRVSRQLNLNGASVSYSDRRQQPRAGHFTLPEELDHLPKHG